jgi:hypothetical protein
LGENRVAQARAVFDPGGDGRHVPAVEGFAIPGLALEDPDRILSDVERNPYAFTHHSQFSAVDAGNQHGAKRLLAGPWNQIEFWKRAGI